MASLSLTPQCATNAISNDKVIELTGGELGIPTDMDQRSWVFLNNPKNTLPLKENPKKYFPKSETLKNTLLKHNSFSES